MTMDATKKHGTPNWADCATTDLSALEKFYSAVVGWTADHVTGSDGSTYSQQRLDGKLVAGIYELNQQMSSMGVSPHWGTYVEVDNLEMTLELVKAEGGMVLDGPLEEPDVGIIAIIQDPVGAYLRLWHSTPNYGGEVFNIPGAMIWNELNTKEPEKATSFYEKVLGVVVETMKDPTPYTLLKVDGRPVAGVLKTTPEIGDFPPSWDVYFASSDVDDTMKKVIAAGGKALRGPFDIPGADRMAVFQDPHDAVFEVIKMEMTEG